MFDYENILGLNGWILAAAFLISLYFISLYVRLLRLRRQVYENFSRMDVLLKKRDVEIPKLVVVVQKYLSYEQVLFTRLAKARHVVSESTGRLEHVESFIQAEAYLQGALEKLLQLSKLIPEMESNENFHVIIKQFKQLDSAISDRRKQYNFSVENFDSVLQSFPNRMFAKLFKFQNYNTLELDGIELDDRNLDVLFDQYKHGVGNY
ncbi:LemA family protein [Thiomicrorhabdus sp.]|uniref:LemA family protein n=1 Tax=Thiomicrorhabdus sp. TaxID=2039724 RepID=UPI00356A8734